MFLIRLSICIDFIITPVTPGLGHSNLHKKSITIGELSGQYYFGQKGQSYCSQRGQSCLAKRVKVAWLFHSTHNPNFFVCKITLCRAVRLYVNRSRPPQSNLPQDFFITNASKCLCRWSFYLVLPFFSAPLPPPDFGNGIVTQFRFKLAFGRFYLALAKIVKTS